MGKIRPAIIASFKNNLLGHCLVLPISSGKQDRGAEEWAHASSINLVAGRQSFVVCNHLYTVSTARLQPLEGARIPRLDKAEFKLILAKVFHWLPRLE